MKIKKKFLLMATVALLASMLLCACGKPATFDGSKSGDADHFDIEFKALNTSFSHDLEMKAGESIGVSVEKTAGNIAVTIQMGDEDPVYQGNHMETSDFQVGISKDGTYTLTVTGEKAKGHVVMTRIAASQPEEVAEVPEEADAAAEEVTEADAAASEEPAEEETTESNAESEAIALYNDIIKKILSEEEYISDEGEAYEYSFAEKPAYALYDVDKDGVPELFITGRMDNPWHTYGVYYVHNGEAIHGRGLNGYIPDQDLWIYGFDFMTGAYKFNSTDGFTEAWQIEYPVEDEPSAKISYDGQEAKEISNEEIDELLKGEILEPEDLRWKPLNEDTDLTDEITDDAAAAETTEAFFADRIVESVTWNNDKDDYWESPESVTEFTFHMSDGTEQVLDATYNPMITGMEMIDIDNDGMDEFILNASFANTAGEFEFIYAFKLVDGQIIQLYPTIDIPKMAEETWPGMTRGDVTNTSIVTVEKDGKKLNALEVSMLEKGLSDDGPLVEEIYHETIIYNKDHWEELK